MMWVSLDKNSTTLTDSLQEFKGVRDKLEDLVPWLTTLKESLTRASDDSQEAERREQLKRSVSSLDYLLAQANHLQDPRGYREDVSSIVGEKERMSNP